MLSVIVCSVNPQYSEKLQSNIEATIGNDTKYEFLIYDNRTNCKPIAAVYNLCARQATGDNLLFIHEDVLFITQNWGKAIEQKLAEPDCGVIGFAGSIVKPSVYSGWAINTKYSKTHYWGIYNGRKKFIGRNISKTEKFSEVVTLDGLGLFVKKDVHNKFPFDEKILTGFHCYDVDYTLEIAKHYKNYCCTIDVLHFSNGTFDIGWIHQTVKMHNQKWNTFLPMMIHGLSFTKQEMRRLNDDALWQLFRSCYKCSFRSGVKSFMIYCGNAPISVLHFRRIVLGFIKIFWKHTLVHIKKAVIKRKNYQREDIFPPLNR